MDHRMIRPPFMGGMPPPPGDGPPFYPAGPGEHFRYDEPRPDYRQGQEYRPGQGPGQEFTEYRPGQGPGQEFTEYRQGQEFKDKPYEAGYEGEGREHSDPGMRGPSSSLEGRATTDSPSSARGEGPGTAGDPSGEGPHRGGYEETDQHPTEMNASERPMASGSRRSSADSQDDGTSQMSRTRSSQKRSDEENAPIAKRLRR